MHARQADLFQLCLFARADADDILHQMREFHLALQRPAEIEAAAFQFALHRLAIAGQRLGIQNGAHAANRPPAIRPHHAGNPVQVMRPANPYGVVILGPLQQEGGDILNAAIPEQFDAFIEAVARIWRQLHRVHREHRHLAAERDQACHHIVGTHEARADVAVRDGVLDHQHAATAGGGAAKNGAGGVGRLFGEQEVAVFGQENILIAPHQRHRPIRIARRAVFQMHDDHIGIVDHAATGFPDPHAQIGVFVIGGRKTGIERAQFEHERARQHQEQAGDVIDIAREAEFRLERIAVPPIAGRAAIAEQHATGFLQQPMRAHHLAAQGTDAGIVIHPTHGIGERVGRQDDIVVEQQHIATAGCADALVAGVQEAQIGLVAQQPQPVHPPFDGAGVIDGGVVDQDGLKAHPGVAGQGEQGLHRQVELIIGADNHAHIRRFRLGELERRADGGHRPQMRKAGEDVLARHFLARPLGNRGGVGRADGGQAKLFAELQIMIERRQPWRVHQRRGDGMVAAIEQRIEPGRGLAVLKAAVEDVMLQPAAHLPDGDGLADIGVAGGIERLVEIRTAGEIRRVGIGQVVMQRAAIPTLGNLVLHMRMGGEIPIGIEIGRQPQIAEPGRAEQGGEGLFGDVGGIDQQLRIEKIRAADRLILADQQIMLIGVAHLQFGQPRVMRVRVAGTVERLVEQPMRIMRQEPGGAVMRKAAGKFAALNGRPHLGIAREIP